MTTWFDPKTQRNFRAVKYSEERLFSVGYRMVERDAQLQAQYDAAGQDRGARYRFDYQRELADLSIGMRGIYGQLVFSLSAAPQGVNHCFKQE